MMRSPQKDITGRDDDSTTGLRITLGFVALYLTCVFPAFPPQGDAADYAALIKHGVFNIRTSHIGYFAFAYPFAQLANLLSMSLTITLNVLAAVCMGIAVGLSHKIYRQLLPYPAAATFGTIALGSSGIFWYHAEFAEVQALLMLTMFLSVLLYLRRRPISSGALFAGAMLVSQAAAPSAVLYPVMAMRDRNWKRFVTCVLAGTFFLALGVAPVAGDYFLGPRGVSKSLHYYPSGSIVKMLLLFGYRLVENHTILVFPLILGAFVAVSRARWFVAMATALWIAHAWLNLRLGHIEYGFAWMPVYLATAGFIGVGLEHMRGNASRIGHPFRHLSAALLCVAAILAGVLYVLPKRRDAVELQRLVHEIHEQAGDRIVIIPDHQGFVYTYEVEPHIANAFTGSWKNVPASRQDWAALVKSNGTVFVFAYEPHTHIFRRWIFDNPIAHRLIDRHRLADWMSDAGGQGRTWATLAGSDIAVQQLQEWPRASLWRLDRIRGSTDNSAGTN
jgi:hypothetical protein